MSQFRFILQPYRNPGSRHCCPECHRPRSFVRYIDTEEKIVFPDYVGRCNREQKCGYHYSPKQYFADHPEPPKRTATYRRTFRGKGTAKQTVGISP